VKFNQLLFNSFAPIVAFLMIGALIGVNWMLFG